MKSEKGRLIRDRHLIAASGFLTNFAAAIIVLATAAHGFAVLLFNAPSSAIKTMVRPELQSYDGPQLYQGWSMFAPNPPSANLHLVVQAWTDQRMITKSLDVTDYFLRRYRRNRLTTSKPLSEGLAHALPSLVGEQHGVEIVDEAIAMRTAAMVISSEYGVTPLMIRATILKIPFSEGQGRHRSSVVWSSDWIPVTATEPI